MEYFWEGFEKRAEEDAISKWETPAELAGLGTLMYPSVQHLRGKPMKAHKLHKLELAGLGILAAPYAAKAVRGVYRAGKDLYNKVMPGKPAQPAAVGA